MKPFFPNQKKYITDYLSALDDQITAQTQKTKALRQHKKGLMQQIFPSTEGDA
jgi:type I restriction enzyme, S subunit